MFVKHMPCGDNKVSIWHNFLVLHFDQRGMQCQKIVSNQYMNLQFKFSYCMTTNTNKVYILFESGTESRISKQTDGRSNY